MLNNFFKYISMRVKMFSSVSILDNRILSTIDIGKGKLTVGKIYGGLLILENWKASKFGNIPNQKVRTFNI